MVISTQTIKYEKRNQIAYITLNRPDVMNALNRGRSRILRRNGLEGAGRSGR